MSRSGLRTEPPAEAARAPRALNVVVAGLLGIGVLFGLGQCRSHERVETVAPVVRGPAVRPVPTIPPATAPAASHAAPADADGSADAADSDPAADPDWPREIDTKAATILVYQPQLDRYEEGVLDAHAAVAVTKTGQTEPSFGAVWFTSRMETDRDARLCRLYDVHVPRARFPDASPDEEKDLAALIEAEAPRWVHPISMDRMLPALAALEQRTANDERLRNDAPRILVETAPALLVPVDGPAKLGPVAGSSVQRVVNSPVVVLFEPSSRTWWIDAGASWVYATDVDGPYRVAGAAPPEVAAVRTSNDEAGRATTDAAAAGPVPKIVVAHEPSELVVFDGEPEWKPVVGDELSYAANTSSVALRTNADGRVWLLLSGRWFRAPSLREGPWEFVAPDALPACFAQIPEDSEVGGALAHVAGTDLAEEAVLDAQMPHTAAIRRDAATCRVVYDGEPRFETIPGTDIRWAVNTESQVLLYRERYWCCDQGVWFVGFTPNGPWAVADSVPTAFQDIPPENPCYTTRWVYVVDSTPDVVYVSCTPGYYGWYPWHGTVVWGTGWRWSGWYGGYWYPRCSTWGVSVAYDPWWGGWYGGVCLSWGHGWSIGVGLFPDWGWGGPWWGPCGYRPWHDHDRDWGRHHDRTGRFRPSPGRGPQQNVHERVRGDRQRFVGVYGAARNRPRIAPDRLAQRPTSIAARRGPNVPRAATPRDHRGPGPAATQRPQRLRNDVYADRDGKVFRRDPGGRWQVREGRTWRPAQGGEAPGAAPRAQPERPRPERPLDASPQRPPSRPAPTPGLQRDARVRDRGQVRDREVQRVPPTVRRQAPPRSPPPQRQPQRNDGRRRREN